MPDKPIESVPIPTSFAVAAVASGGNSVASSNAASRILLIENLVPEAATELTRHIPEFIDHLEGSTSAAPMLRTIIDNAPVGALGAEQRNIIELLVRVFDTVFSEATIPSPFNKLLAQLQPLLLKTAVVDQQFFYNKNHPARCLLDQLAQSMVGIQMDAQFDDPLYKIIEQLINRLQQEFDRKLDAYSNAANDLRSFLESQQRDAETAVAAHIAEALHEEKMQQAQRAAANDIDVRIDTGEVAGFVEVFLDTQWMRVLTLTHSVAERKPKAHANALKAMDDLVWSIKPKLSTHERTELITRLPAMLSRINAWLNVVKWNGPERITFFSKLVERHAALVQGPVELSPRHQLHLAVNVAQKASERRLGRRARELDAPPVDQYVHLVDRLEVGSWVAFRRHNGVAAPFRLVWLSPRRGRFIFCNAHSGEPFAFTADEIALVLREQGASLITVQPVTTRALLAVLENPDDGC